MGSELPSLGSLPVWIELASMLILDRDLKSIAVNLNFIAIKFEIY
jgi:hypothetical protein